MMTKLLEASQAKLLKHLEDEKKGILIMSRLKKQMEKHKINGL